MKRTFFTAAPQTGAHISVHAAENLIRDGAILALTPFDEQVFLLAAFFG